MRHQFHHALQIMHTGDGGLGDKHDEIGSGHGRNDGTACSRRAVTQNQCMAQLACQFGGTRAHLRHESSRILFGDAEFRMNHRTIICARDIPAPRNVRLAGNRLNRADPCTKAAAFAEERLDTVSHADEVVGRTVHVNSLKMAGRRAFAAAKTGFSMNRVRHSSHKIMGFANRWLQQQMKVGRIDIVVRQHLAFRQTGQRTDDRRLARAAFAADHGDFLVA